MMMIRRSTFIKISTQIAYSNYSLIITKNADKQKIGKQSADLKLRYRSEHNHSFRFQTMKIVKLRILYKYVMGFSEDAQILLEACLCRNKVNEQV